LRKNRYSFTAAAGEAVVIAVDAYPGTLRPRAEIFDADGVFVPGGLAIGGASPSTVLPRTGTYTITVAGDDLRDTGDYNLSLQFSTGRCARLIACGQTLSGSLPGSENATGDGRSQLDSYQFAANAGEAVVFAVAHSSGTLRARGDLYDPSGRVVPGGVVIEGASPAAKLAVSGIYTLVVRDDDLTDSGTYNVSLEFTTGRCAQTIACGQTLPGEIPNGENTAASPQAQLHAFKFDAVAGEAVVFAVKDTAPSVPPRGDLYDPSGRFVPGGVVIAGGTPPIALTATGTYTIVVRDDDLQDPGAYDINLQFTTGRCAAALACGVTKTGTIPGDGNTSGRPGTGAGRVPPRRRGRRHPHVLGDAIQRPDSAACRSLHAGGHVRAGFDGGQRQVAAVVAGGGRLLIDRPRRRL